MSFDASVYLPSLADLIGVAAVVATGMAFVLIGRLVGGPGNGQGRQAEADLIGGWSIIYTFYVYMGTFTGVSLTALIAAVGLLAVTGLARGRQTLWADSIPALRILLIMLPLWILTAPMLPSQWDEFSQWLWSPRYLLDVGAFPAAGLPASAESFPGYPKALPIAMMIASQIAGRFVETSGMLFNLLLMAAVALLVLRLMRQGAGREEGAPGWGLIAAAFLFTLAFPPFVVAKITLTAYAEVGTAAAVAFAAVLGWQATLALSTNDDGHANRLAWQAGLAGSVLIGLKQANLVLFLLILIGIALAGLRTPGASWRGVARVLAQASVVPLATYAAWRFHVAADPAVREMSIQPFASWNIAHIPEMLWTIAGIMVNKSVYFLSLLLVVGLALRSLVRYRAPHDGLLIVAGTVFAGYNAFLLFAYVASFGAYDARNALSFWRYNMHIGALDAATWAYLAGLGWRARNGSRVSPLWGRAALALALLFPVLMAPKLRFDIRAPKIYVREIGPAIDRLLPDGARLAIVDPRDAGFYSKLMRYVLYPRTQVVVSLFYEPPQDLILKALADNQASHAWVHTQTDAARAAFGLPLPDRASYLLAKEGDGWRQIGMWPYPGYALPSDVPD